MKSKILSALGIDPAYIFIFIILLLIVLFVMYTNVMMKYNRLKSSYMNFMRGKDGRNLENAIFKKFEEIDSVIGIVKKNRADIKDIYRKMESNYQKTGIVKYDAFNEMGGKLSFALTLLDQNNSGWIINAMHSRDGCYTYIKEIVAGESYIELADEEMESLERAIYQETYGLNEVKDVIMVKERKQVRRTGKRGNRKSI